MTTAPNQFEIAGPVFKPSTQYLTSQGYPLGTTCWFFEVKINFRCEIICGDTIDSAWSAVVAHLHAEGGLPNAYARNCQRQLEINHQAIHECWDDLLEALRKAVVWGDAVSTHILYRENINWRYLDEARATLATYSSHNAYRRALTSGECLKCLLNGWDTEERGSCPPYPECSRAFPENVDVGARGK